MAKGIVNNVTTAPVLLIGFALCVYERREPLSRRRWLLSALIL